MKFQLSRIFTFAIFSATLFMAFPSTAAETEIATEVSLLIGRPGATDDGEQGALVVPGAVIPVGSDSHPATPQDGGKKTAHRDVKLAHHQISQVADDLVKSLRLSQVEVRYWMPLSLAVGEPHDLPPLAGASNIRLSLELLGFNATMASYEVQFSEGPILLTKTPLTIHRGKQAVVGGLGGDEAPYLFLLIAPAGQESADDPAPPPPVHVTGDIQPPRAIHKTPVKYTPEAKQEKIEGVVVTQTTIEKDGTVSGVNVLKGLPYGLSGAAADAIKQWRFEPALLDGEPITVYYNLTINFRLAKDPADNP